MVNSPEWAQFYYKKNKKKLNFDKLFRYWTNTLLERTINIFSWDGLPFPPHELELLLQCVGFAGITKNNQFPDEIITVYGSASGVTNYPDIFTTFTYATPLCSGMFQIGKQGIFARNNELCVPLKPAIEVYATILSHIDLSIQAVSINGRDNKVFVASTQKVADSVKEYYNALADGGTGVVLDEENFESALTSNSLEQYTTSANSYVSLLDLMETKENILRSFYMDIGINTQKDKRANMNIPEVETNLCRLQFNISDMLFTRQQICKELKTLYKINVTVDVHPEIKRQYELMEAVQRTTDGVKEKEEEVTESEQ